MLLELFGSVSDKLRKTTDMALIDGVLRIFFSNFTVKQYGKGKEQRCEIAHKLKEPWEWFLNNDDFSCGREEAFYLKLLNYIIEDYDSSVSKLADYNIRCAPSVRSEVEYAVVY